MEGLLVSTDCRQDVTRVIVFDHAPSEANPASVVDIMELSGSVSEAVQLFKRHYIGGRWAGVFAGRYVAAQAGYTLPDDGRTFYPLAYGRVL